MNLHALITVDHTALRKNLMSLLARKFNYQTTEL